MNTFSRYVNAGSASLETGKHHNFQAVLTENQNNLESNSRLAMMEEDTSGREENGKPVAPKEGSDSNNVTWDAAEKKYINGVLNSFL